MKQCEEKEGYLLMYASSDEMNVDLINKDHYERIMSKFPKTSVNNCTTVVDYASDEADKAAFETEVLYSWFSQTLCNEDWPYKNVKILGTVHIWAC